MDQKNTFTHPKIKIVYYTHPLCPVSGKMQEHWRRLLSDFGQYISFKFCMAETVSGLPPETKTSFACQAVKTAELQSPWAADLYLDALRSVVATGERDISRLEVLVEVAREVGKKNPVKFNFDRFSKEFDTRKSRQAVQEDLQKIRINRIDQLPTITFTVDSRGFKTTGYKSYEQLLQLLMKISPTTFPDLPARHCA